MALLQILFYILFIHKNKAMMTYLKNSWCEVAKVLGNQHYTQTYIFSVFQSLFICSNEALIIKLVSFFIYQLTLEISLNVLNKELPYLANHVYLYLQQHVFVVIFYLHGDFFPKNSV